MKLYALSDLHLANEQNRQGLYMLPPHPDDWLILAGDIGETEEHLRFALFILTQRFKQLLWTPGNHDLWAMPSDRQAPRGEAKYRRLVAICRESGVLTPEDEYVLWKGAGPACRLAPLFTLYDYSFRPKEIPADRAVEWAAESGVLCSDEVLLDPVPYRSREAWCAERCRYTEQRLQATSPALPFILIDHFPLRQDLVQLFRIPRFSLWCGTRLTEDWHTRYHALAVIYGHLHIRGTHMRDGVRFEEVSLGYPRDWDPARGVERYLREILPGPRAKVT